MRVRIQFLQDVEHMINERSLPIYNQKNWFPLHSRGPYEYQLHYQSADPVILNDHVGPPIMLAIEPTTTDFVHVVQPLSNTWHFAFPS